MKKLNILLIAISTLLVSCNVDVKEESKSAKYSYNYDINGCQTGEQNFASFDAYCAGLKNDQLNKGCARSMRREQYVAASCPGDFDSGN